MNALAIRSLLDKARSYFVRKSGYKGWDDILEKLSFPEAKKKIVESLDEQDWSGINIKTLVDLVVDSQPFRSTGNQSAHKFAKEEIEAAIGVGGGEWKTELQVLYHKLY